MELYIAKKNENLYEIAARFNLSFEELVQYNRTYKFRKDLADCPVLIPEHKRLVESAKVFIPQKEGNCLSFPLALIEKHNCRLKEMIMAAFYIEGYREVLTKKVEEVQEKMRKYLEKKKTVDISKISTAMSYKGIIATVESFISAIKNHQIEELKGELRNFKKWPTKIVLLFSSDVNRDDDRQKLLGEIIALWRDYILDVATKDFIEAEKNFDNIEDKSRDIAKILFD